MKKSIPFAKQVRTAEKSMADVFANTNVSRSATRNAMVMFKEIAEEYIAALDENEAAGIKDAHELDMQR